MKDYPCPACQTTGRHRQFRSRTYGPGKMESDNHPLTYVWNDPQLVQVHPPLYFLFFCTSCYFTVSSENYADPQSNLYGKACARTHRANWEAGDPVIQLLGARIDYDTLAFEDALWMHFLAIYIQLLPDDEMRDHHMIARLYLRVAWLYREEQADEAPGDGGEDASRSTDSSRHAVVAALKELDGILHRGNEIRDCVVAALKADEPRRGSQHGAVYEKSMETISRLFDALHSESYRLKATFNRSYVTALNDVGKSYSSEFVEEVKREWSYAPADEIEALRSAIEYFERAIAQDARLNEPDPFFKTSALIIDLELRCDDLDAAFKKARGVVSSIIQDREKILTRIASVENESHKMELMKQLTAANRSIERANDLHRAVVDQVISREMPEINRILADHGRSTTGQKKVALLSNGVTHGIVYRLEERKII